MDLMNQYEEMILPLNKHKVKCSNCKNWKYNREKANKYRSPTRSDECSVPNPGFGGYSEQSESDVKFLLAIGEPRKVIQKDPEVLRRQREFMARRRQEAGYSVPTTSYQYVDSKPSVLNHDNRCICFVGTRRYNIIRMLTLPFWGLAYLLEIIRKK